MSPNILAAIGQASPVINKTMTDIEERPKQALRWGWEQEQAGQQKAINQARIETLQMDLAEKKRLEKERKEPMDIMTIPQVMDLDQATKNKLIKDLDAAGITKNGVGEKGKISDHFKTWALEPKLFAPYIELETEGRRNNFFEAHEKLNKELMKKDSDPKKIDELRNAVNVASGRYKKALEKGQKNEAEQQFVNNLNAAKDTIIALKRSDDWKLLSPKEQMGIMAIAGYGGVEEMQKFFIEIIKEKKETETKGTALTIEDSSSQTGWSYRYPDGTIIKGAKPPQAAAEVKIDIGGKSLTEMGKKMGEKVVEDYKDAQQAYSSLQQLKEAKKLLSSNMITGFGADWILNAGKALKRIGFDVASDAIANTEAYASQMGRQVGQIIKQFGAGTGLSDADRDYAEKIAGGKITLTKQSLEKIVYLNEKALRNIVRNYNKKAEKIMSKPGAEDLPHSLIIDVDPELMGESIEEKKVIEGKTYIKKNGKWYEQ